MKIVFFFGKITSAPHDLKMTLNATGSKVPYVLTACDSQISLSVALQSLISQIIEAIVVKIQI